MIAGYDMDRCRDGLWLYGGMGDEGGWTKQPGTGGQ